MDRDLMERAETAFAAAPGRAEQFPAAGQQRVLAAVQEQVAARAHLIALSGPPGSGRTTLLRALRASLKQGLVGLIEDPAPGRMLVDIARSVQLDATDDNESLLRRRLVMLLAMTDQQRQPIIELVDDADRLGTDDLDLLLHFFPSGHATLVLAGTGEPDGWLAGCSVPTGRAVPDAVHRLEPFTADETADYIRHRLRTGGLPEDLIAPPLTATIHRQSAGLPGRINELCRAALSRAEDARAQAPTAAPPPAVTAPARETAAAEPSRRTNPFAVLTKRRSEPAAPADAAASPPDEPPPPETVPAAAAGARTGDEPAATPGGAPSPPPSPSPSQPPPVAERAAAPPPSAGEGGAQYERFGAARSEPPRWVAGPAPRRERRRAAAPPRAQVQPARTRRLRRSARRWRTLAILSSLALIAALTRDLWVDRLPTNQELLDRLATWLGEPADDAPPAPPIAPPLAREAPTDTDRPPPPVDAPGAGRAGSPEPAPRAPTGPAAAPSPESMARPIEPDSRAPATAAVPQSDAPAPGGGDTAGSGAAESDATGSDAAALEDGERGESTDRTAPTPEQRPLTRAERAEVARLYAERAEYEWRSGDLQAAALSIRLGLASDPGNPRLLEMRRMLQGFD